MDEGMDMDNKMDKNMDMGNNMDMDIGGMMQVSSYVTVITGEDNLF